jgi:hypothetical protein
LNDRWRGMDWEFKVRWQLVGLVGGLLEPGRIVDVVNSDNVHDRSLHLFGHEYQMLTDENPQTLAEIRSFLGWRVRRGLNP